MALPPLSPGGVVGGEFREPPLEIFSLDPHQPLRVGVPERARFPVVQNEGISVGPPGGRDGQRHPVDLAAVHGRQVNEWSIPHGDRLPTKVAVGDLVAPEG